jgi:hypothetical protein
MPRSKKSTTKTSAYFGIFWAYFVANWSYSKLKMIYYFPNPQEKIPNLKLQNETIEYQIIKSLKLRAVMVLKCLKMASQPVILFIQFITAKFKS